MIFLGGTSGFHDEQVDFQNHLSIGQVDFLTKFEPCYVTTKLHGTSTADATIMLYFQTALFSRFLLSSYAGHVNLAVA